jgi:transposase-like protein
MACPRCKSVSVTKDGTTELGGQRFRWSRCGRRFTRRSSSAFSGRAFPDDIIAVAVRWYFRYRLSYAEVSEWLAERGVLVDQSTIYRWVQRFLPLFGEVARKYREPVDPDWRVDETWVLTTRRCAGSCFNNAISLRNAVALKPAAIGHTSRFLNFARVIEAIQPTAFIGLAAWCAPARDGRACLLL